MKSYKAFVTIAVMLLGGFSAFAEGCYGATIVSPTPFMGNDGEVVLLSDNSVWRVVAEYEYMYEYYPIAIVCPTQGQMHISGKSLSIVPVRGPYAFGSPPPAQGDIVVVLKREGCSDYFVADGPQGYYLLEWYGGFEPSEGDTIVADLGSYGFKDVVYPEYGQTGRVYVDDYLLGKSRVIEKYAEKCD